MINVRIVPPIPPEATPPRMLERFKPAPPAGLANNPLNPGIYYSPMLFIIMCRTLGVII